MHYVLLIGLLSHLCDVQGIMISIINTWYFNHAMLVNASIGCTSYLGYIIGCPAIAPLTIAPVL